MNPAHLEISRFPIYPLRFQKSRDFIQPPFYLCLKIAINAYPPAWQFLFAIQDNNSGENKTFSIAPKIHRPSSNERSFAAECSCCHKHPARD
jgi:hypothetical protein